MKVELNGRTYEVVPRVSRQGRRNGREALVPVEEFDVELFTQSFDTLGGQSQERIGPFNSKIFPNLTHGFGRTRVASDSARNPDEYRRFLDATVDTRWAGDIRLGIQYEPTIHSALNVIRAITDFKGNVWGLWENPGSTQILSRDLTASTHIWGNGGTVSSGTTAVALDMIPHKTKLIALYASANDHVAEYSTDGVTWTAAATTVIAVNLLSNVVTAHEEIDAGLLAEIGGEAVAVVWDEVSGSITFFSTADDGDTWKDEAVDIPSGNGPQGVAVMLGIDNEDKLFVCTREGLWEIDTAPATWTTRKIFVMTASNDNGRRMKVHSDGALWFSQGVDDDSAPTTYRMFISSAGTRSINPVPNDLGDGDGVVTEMLGPIHGMYSSGQFLYASIGGGKASRNARIICHNGSGWHSMHRNRVANQEISPVLYVTSEDDGTPRLLFSVRSATNASEVQFLGQPDANPQSGVTINRRIDGYVDLPFIDGGMPLIPGIWLRLEVSADGLSTSQTGEYIDVTYGKDDEARTVNDAGDILDGTSSLELPKATPGKGESSKALAIRLTLNRDNDRVRFKGTATANGSAVTSVTYTHIPSTADNRVMIVGVSTFDNVESDTIPTGIIHDTGSSDAFTKIGSFTKANSGGFIGISMWYLANPTFSGNNDVVVTFNAAVTHTVIGSIDMTGASQTVPAGVAVLHDGSGTSATVDLIADVNDLVVDTLCLDSAGVSQAATVGGQQTSRWNSDNTDILGAGSSEGQDLLTGTSTMSWSSFSSSQPFFLMAVVIPPAVDTDTPKIKDVIMNYLKIPPALQGYIFTVDVEQSDGTPARVIADLKKARDLDTLPTFSYGTSGKRFVDVKNLRWLPEVVDRTASPGSIAPDTLAQRAGFVEVRAEEVI